jgi:chemotaxis response regulator CheB
MQSYEHEWKHMSRNAVVRVVLVDDHPVVRDGLRALLSSVEDMAVVVLARRGPVKTHSG